MVGLLHFLDGRSTYSNYLVVVEEDFVRALSVDALVLTERAFVGIRNDLDLHPVLETNWSRRGGRAGLASGSAGGGGILRGGRTGLTTGSAGSARQFRVAR